MALARHSESARRFDIWNITHNADHKQYLMQVEKKVNNIRNTANTSQSSNKRKYLIHQNVKTDEMRRLCRVETFIHQRSCASRQNVTCKFTHPLKPILNDLDDTRCIRSCQGLVSIVAWVVHRIWSRTCHFITRVPNYFFLPIWLSDDIMSTNSIKLITIIKNLLA